MSKNFLFLLLTIGMLFSCQQPGTKEVIPAVKKKASISGLVNLRRLVKVQDTVRVEIRDPLNYFDPIPFFVKEVKLDQEFTINDIPIPKDKSEYEVTVRIIIPCCAKNINTNLVNNQVSKLGTFTFSPKDGYGIGLYFKALIVDENDNPLKEVLITDITDNEVNDSFTSDENGIFENKGSDNYPITLELKYKNNIMSFIVKREYTYTRPYKIKFKANARTISGQIFNKDKNPAGDIPVKILNEDIASKTDKDGKFELRGVPLSEVTLILNDSVNIKVSITDNSNEVKLEPIFINN